MRRTTFLSMLNSTKELLKTIWKYSLNDHSVIEEDYPYNTEFGDGKSNKEMESIDTENKTLPNMKWYKNYKKI